MTETRKQIIELIEPYMDKTLSFGCYIKHGPGYYQLQDYLKVDKKENSEVEYLYTGGLEVCKATEIEKVFGHYDITAVLKYIDSYIEADYDAYEEYDRRGIINISKDVIVFDDMYHSIRCDKCKCHTSYPSDEIPNKPLHLYTEQEEKDLLELLKKLK